ncbi:MAG TPA: acyl carrier protein [Solirubrobacteraceae bacterium]|nr:acyl carrier protein [Solirubrobacteraceae bacterium]
MTESEARETLLAALAEVAPETAGADVEGDVELTEQLDLDSMDFLSYITSVSERTGREIPELDYPRLRTLDDGVAYLVA